MRTKVTSNSAVFELDRSPEEVCAQLGSVPPHQLGTLLRAIALLIENQNPFSPMHDKSVTGSLPDSL